MRWLSSAVAAALALLTAAPAVPAQAPERAEAWAVGDAATPNDGARRLAAYIRSRRPDRFLYLGDVYEDGTAREFRLHYDPLYGSLAGITDPTPGNHGWDNRFSGYYTYWRAKKGCRQPPWSSTSLAGWQILSLNSMADHGPARISCSGCEGRSGRTRATIASGSRTSPASAPASTRTIPGLRRSGTRCAGTRRPS